MSKLFDFIIIGAMKSGTTTLHDLLSNDKRIALPVNKEAPYFTSEAEMALGFDAFIKKYYVNTDGKIIGKVTPHYMLWAEDAVKNISLTSADSKIIAILRDPIDRLVSHYSMCVGLGLEKRDINEAIENCLGGSDDCELTPTNSYIACSEYGRILAQYYETFDKANILVLNFNQLIEDKSLLIQQIYKHIDLEVDSSIGSGAARSMSRGGKGKKYRQLMYSFCARNRAFILPFVPRKQRLALRFKFTEMRAEAFSPNFKVGDIRQDIADRLRKHFEEGARSLSRRGLNPYWIEDGNYPIGQVFS